jgi:opacity protein-like surface antigen
MKKVLLTLVVATACIGTSQAQLHSRSQSYAGLKVGGSAAMYTGDNTRNLWFVYGLHGGLFANLALAKPFSIQPEVLYSMKGVKDNSTPVEITQRLTYIDVPVAFRASASDFFVEAGPQAGFLLSAKSDATGENVNVKSNFRSVDFGYILGVGYQPQRGGLGISGRYNGGFLSVAKDPIDGTEAADVRNSVFQVSLTYSKSRIKKNKKQVVK